MKGMGNLSKEERPEIGKLANEVRATLTQAFEAATQALHHQQQEQQLAAEAVDITLPGRKPAYGKAHPITQTLARIEAIFTQIGFQVVTGPEVETEYYNFDALNTPRRSSGSRFTRYLLSNGWTPLADPQLSSANPGNGKSETTGPHYRARKILSCGLRCLTHTDVPSGGRFACRQACHF